MNRRSWRWAAAAGPLALLLWMTIPATGQSTPKIGEWRTYGADLSSTRYSPLDQINAENFNKLEVAWRFKTDGLGPRQEFNLQSTPLMVNGVMYAAAGTRRAAVALDAATGEMLWMHSLNEGPRGESAPRQLSGRGLAYWSDGREERILYVTPGYQLIALNAKTGARIAGFGKDGIVDLKLDDDQVMDPVKGEIGLHAAPVVAGNTIIVGAAHLPGGGPKSKTNEKGYVRGFDVRTGKRLWIFHTIPRPGEFGNDTWLNDSWSYTGNTGVWAQMSVDEENGLVFLPVELPTGDYYGGHHPGNALYGESLVAVDLRTGQRKWHYQFIHHGIWDFDMPCAPIIADLTVNGRVIKAVAQPTKQGWVYVFDRLTGQPVWPFEERPVEKGTVPGEWYAPTQPFVTKPPPFERQGVSIDDLIDFTPELRAEAVKLVSRYKIGPLYTPPIVSQWPGPLATLMLPNATGGANWQGGAFDPETKIFYIFSNTNVSALGLVPGTPERNGDFAWVQGTARDPNAPAPAAGGRCGGGRGGPGAAPGGGAPAAPGGGALSAAGSPQAPAAGRGGGGGGEGGGGGVNVQGLPLIKPPYGRITALDLQKGEMVWQIAHGETPDNIKNHPALKGLNIPRTGRQGRIGVLVTKTLVVAGEGGFITTPQGRGAYLRAYDKATGKEVGAVYMPAPQTGSPMTYSLNGRQYLTVPISGPGYSAEFLTLRLGT
ncbi:MAG: quinoprotein glucose dehydrogenase [Acidobacteria bacterium RIFCSPLOWO2_02_FULL_65_29]|nr:MAG: quinoprotein glucose dehydrogenase [Acidobacteria bacterium RIFCSPLOWO2_02_FULL_65_29]